MAKLAPYPGTKAVARAKSYKGRAAFSGMCQAFTVTMFGTGAVGDFDGDRDADAVDGWKKAVAKGKVVRASTIKDFTKIPAGVALYWSGGSRGYGHAAVSIGGGRMVTTDASGGKIGEVAIKGWWSRSHTFLGYVEVEGNGHTLREVAAVKPTFTATKDTGQYRVAATELNGRDFPTTTHGKVVGIRKVGYVLTATERATVLGQTWIKATDGRWYSTGYLVPLAAKPAVATVRVFGVNAAAYYERDTYDARVPKLGDMREGARASLCVVTESNTYADGQQLNEEFGWGGVRYGTSKNASFVLHGKDTRISTAVHFDPTKYEVLAEGQFDTLPGSTHNGATWALLRHKATGVIFLVVVTHLQYLPKGANKVKTKYDTERQNQLAGALDKADDIAADAAKQYRLKKVPVLVGEDFNGARTDAFDGAGKALAAAGYVDVEQAKESGDTRATIDRLGLKNAKAKEYRAYRSNGGTDHTYAVGAVIELTNG